MDISLSILNIVLIPALSPLFLGIIRKIKARMQSRRGAGILQPYRDIAKLLRKDEVISKDASWIFTAAPYIIFGSTLALAAGVPLLAGAHTLLPFGDILVFAYTLALGAFFLALAGMDTGNAFGGFGSSREMMIASLTEGGLILSLAGVAFIAGSTNFAVMSLAVGHLFGFALLPLILCAAAFWIALLAENARYPVDNPATHLELTMVHEAMILEYSGKRLALMEWAASNKLLIFLAVFVNIFVPWGLGAGPLWIAIGITAIKLVLAASAIALIESLMAKFRIFRVPDLLFTSFVLAVISILIIVL